MEKNKDIEFDLLKRFSCDALIRILEEAPGPKDIIIDAGLMKLLDKIADAKILRSHGVGKMFRFERLPPPSTCGQMMYFLHPSTINIKHMCDHIHNMEKEKPLQFHVVCIPRVVSWATEVIEEEGLVAAVAVHELTPNFIALDRDFLSLEMNTFLKDAFVDGDFSLCVSVARALNTVQEVFGRFSRVAGHGRAAAAVASALNALQTDQEQRQSADRWPDEREGALSGGELLLFDRDLDPVTPLLTQLTYAGALDEHLGAKAGVVEMRAKADESKSDDRQTAKISLDSRADEVLASIRDRHFAGVPAYLARRLQQLQARKTETASLPTSQLRSFVGGGDLRRLQAIGRSLATHVAACELVTAAAQRRDLDLLLTTEHALVSGAASTTEGRVVVLEAVARQWPHAAAMRLLCLVSQAKTDGLSRRDYNTLAGRIVAGYGPRHVVTLMRLRRAGFLLVAESGGLRQKADDASSGAAARQAIRQAVTSLASQRHAGHWPSLRDRLKLVPDSDVPIDLHAPTHPSYVFNGAYEPLFARLAADVSRDPAAVFAWPDLLKGAPGGSFVKEVGPTSPDANKTSVVVVMVLGGVTFAELAAIKLAAAGAERRLVVAATGIINGTSLVRSLAPQD